MLSRPALATLGRRLATTKEVAHALGCSDRTIRDKCQRGLFRARRFAGGTMHWLIEVDSEGYPLEPADR